MKKRVLLICPHLVIKSSGKIYCIGRTGRFKYNNMDDSIDQGLKIAE